VFPHAAKFRLLLVTTLVWCSLASVLLAAPLRVATFNIDNGLRAPGTSSHENVARILERIDADVVGFQELQSDTANLAALGARLGLPYNVYSIAPNVESMQVGLLSRYPVTAYWISGGGITRPILLAQISVPGAARKPWVAVLHLKCCGETGGDEQYVRAVELYRLRQALPEFILPGDPVLITGDFNLVAADDHSYASGRFTGIDYPLMAWADADDYFVPEGIFKLDARHAGPVGETWTWRGNSRFPPSALDHIMANAAARAGGVAVEIFDVQKDAAGIPGLPKAGSPLPAGSSYGSDHLPIFADLQLAEAPPARFRVSPGEDFLPVGNLSGQFNTLEMVYTIANDKETPLDWFISESASWLEVGTTAGLTDVSGQSSVTVSLTAQAASLPPGDYEAEILFTDRDTGSVVVRGVSLRIMSEELRVDHPAGVISTTAESFTYRGSMDSRLLDGLTWSNRANGLTGTLAYAARWSVDIPLAPGTNNIVDFRAAYAVTNAPVVRASDSPTDPAYADWWFPDSNGGEGFEPWQFRRDRGWAGYALFGPDVFNIPPAFGGAFSLWAMGDGVTTARRHFDQALTTGDTFHLQFDNNWIEGGKSVGFALTDSAGTKRFDFHFVGGETFYRVDDAEGSRVTGLAYTDQGLELAVQMVGENSYRLTAGNDVIITGTLAPGGPVSAMVATNNGSGAGTAFDFYLGAMRIEDSSGIRASDGPADPAYAGGWTDGSRGGTGFGPWMINAVSLVGGDAGHARFFTNVWNVPPSFGGVFSLWAHGNGYSEARRGFIQAMEIGEAFVLQFDNNLIEEGKLVGFSLADAAGVDRFKFLCYGGQQVYWVEDSGDARATALPVAPNGLELRFELTGENSYRLSTGNFAAEGILADGGPLAQLRAFNYGSGVGTAYDFYLGALRLETPSIDTLEVNATSLQVWREPDPADFTDGLPNHWWVQYFGTIEGVSAADDSDGDGFSNAQEYALGTDPTDPTSTLRARPAVVAAGQISIAWDAIEGKTYRIIGTTDLTAEHWQQVGEPLTAPATGPQTVTHTTEAPSHFYRVELVP
jgi:endonuclease/exonuclease/phosphatase family metal-dependent hydrolase